MKLDPAVLWFTGLSGSGKSTLAAKVVERLQQSNVEVEHLDGDSIRKLFPLVGFTKEARDEHVRRVGFLASRLEAHKVFTVVSMISPYQESREFARKLCKNFVEVYVCTPIEVCEKRDARGLYAKARRGEIKNFTGIDAPYEPPLHSELRIDTGKVSPDQGVEEVLQFLEKRNVEKGKV